MKEVVRFVWPLFFAFKKSIHAVSSIVVQANDNKFFNWLLYRS
jgi:hypothetical protein